MVRSIFIGITACILSLASCDTGKPDASVSQLAEPFQSEYFTVSIEGAGEPVILVPGLASNAAVWDGTVEALQGDYQLHTIQISGFGGAPARGNTGNTDILDDLAGDLAAYSQTLGGRVTMVGHSLGGLVTMMTELRPDDDLDQIIIVDVLPFFSVLMDETATAESIAPTAQFMKAALIAQSEDVFETSQANALSALVLSDEDRALALSWSMTTDRAVMGQAMSEVLVTDLRDSIKHITTPTTVIFAKHDDIANLDTIEAHYRDLYAPLRDGKVTSIEGALHFIMLDQPEAFLDALRTALRY